MAGAPTGWYHGAMEPLPEVVVREALVTLPGWTLDGDALRRQVRLSGFRPAIDLIVAIADAAERADHHPELVNVHARLTIRLTTHEAGGVTERDLGLARAIETLIASAPIAG